MSVKGSLHEAKLPYRGKQQAEGGKCQGGKGRKKPRGPDGPERRSELQERASDSPRVPMAHLNLALAGDSLRGAQFFPEALVMYIEGLVSDAPVSVLC